MPSTRRDRVLSDEEPGILMSIRETLHSKDTDESKLQSIRSILDGPPLEEGFEIKLRLLLTRPQFKLDKDERPVFELNQHGRPQMPAHDETAYVSPSLSDAILTYFREQRELKRLEQNKRVTRAMFTHKDKQRLRTNSPTQSSLSRKPSVHTFSSALRSKFGRPASSEGRSDPNSPSTSANSVRSSLTRS